MDNTNTTQERAAALELATRAAESRFLLKSFQTEDGDNRDPVTSAAPKITMWGVFDDTARADGRNGMVWLPKEGFQAAFTEAEAADLCAAVRARFVAEAMGLWDTLNNAEAVPAHQVVRLDNFHEDAAAQAEHTRLAQLTAMYDQVKREADDAAALLKEVTDGIKAELRRIYPQQADFTVTSGALAHPLTLQRVVSRVFDSAGARTVLSTEQYDALCKDRESWILKAKKG
jgi:hypothetical protein